jgi:hypothetical protein
MSALTQQLEQLKEQQQELEERIQKETKQKLENESSIERLETLVQPLTEMLERKRVVGTSGNTPIYEKSTRENCTENYEREMQKYNNRLIRQPPTFTNPCYPPQKNKQILKEEIYTTIISILKKQEKKIDEISSTIDKYFGDFNKRDLIKNYKKIL